MDTFLSDLISDHVVASCLQSGLKAFIVDNHFNTAVFHFKHILFSF